MPTDRADNPRNDRPQQSQSDLKLQSPQARQTAHPLIVAGPEAVRDSHC